MVQVGVRQVFDGQDVSLCPRLPASVQVVFLFEILLQRPVRVFPGAEVDQSAADLLRPPPRLVREEGEVGVGLAGLGGGCRMISGHGDDSSTRFVTAFRSGR